MNEERIFAVWLKQWIELRACHKPPRLVRSVRTREYETQGRNYRERILLDPATGRWDYPRITHKRSLKMAYSTVQGGKVIGVLTTNRFTRLFKVALRKDGVLELSPDMVALLREKGVIKCTT